MVGLNVIFLETPTAKVKSVWFRRCAVFPETPFIGV